MPLKAEYDKYDKLVTFPAISSQAIVESKVQTRSLYIDKILAVNSRISLTGAEAVSGEIRYSGMLYYSIIYQTENNKIDRLERATEFNHKVDCENSAPSCKLKVMLSVAKTEVKKENNSIVLSSIVDAQIRMSKMQTMQYLSGGEDLIFKSDTQRFIKVYNTKGSFEVEDECEVEWIQDILLHNEQPVVLRTEAGHDSVKIWGEVAVNLCALKNIDEEKQTLVSLERLVPFNIELPCEDVDGDGVVDAIVSIKDANIQAVSDEDRNRCKIIVELSLEAVAEVYEKETVFVCVDAFSRTNELNFEINNCVDEYLKSYISFNEKVNGISVIDGEINFNHNLQTVVCEKTEAHSVVKDGLAEISGVIFATLIYSDRENNISSLEATLPFSFIIKNDIFQSGDNAEINMICLNTLAKQKREGEIEIESNLKFAVKLFSKNSCAFISDLVEGALVVQNPNAITVYVPQENDGLWELSKKLKKNIDEVARCNPELEFPLKGNERIIIYRKQDTNY